MGKRLLGNPRHSQFTRFITLDKRQANIVKYPYRVSVVKWI